MKIDFAPMSQEQFDRYMEAHLKEYAEDRMITDYQPREEAEATVLRQSLSTLPEGLLTKHHHFFNVRNARRENVGYVWLRVDPEQKLGWIMFITIFPDHRRQGYGRDAMKLLASKAKELGARVLWLNVMGHNLPAQKLYESVGMRVAAIHMNQLL